MAKIYKTGNSLVVALRKDLLHVTGLKEGDEIFATINTDGDIVLKPINKNK